MKRIKCLLPVLAIALVCICMPSKVNAADTVKLGKDVTATIHEDGTCYVTGDGPMYDTFYLAPNEYQMGEDNAFGYNYDSDYDGEDCLTKRIKAVYIDEGVTTIGTHTFAYCSNLKYVEVPATITKIGAYAFAYTGVDTLEFPKSVTSIGKYAFQGTDFTSVRLPSKLTKVSEGLFYNCRSLHEVIFGSKVATIEKSAFSECDLYSLYLPDSVKTIKTDAFLYNQNMTSVRFGKYLESIGYFSFGCCESLTKLTIPSRVKKISAVAFQSCKGVKTIKVKTKYLTTSRVERDAFKSMKSLKKVYVPRSKYSYYKKILRKRGVKKSVVFKKL